MAILVAAPRALARRRRRVRSRLSVVARVATVAALVPLLLSGCADGGTNAAPPLVVCGTTLSAAAAGAVLTDATTDVTVAAVTVGGTVDLLLTQGCDTGASYTVEHGTAHEVVRARTADGGLAAVTLEPTSSSFDVLVRHADGTSSTARVRLAG